MKTKNIARIVCIVLLLCINIAIGLYLRDFFPVARIFVFIFALNLAPPVLLLLNPKSKFARAITYTALVAIGLFGIFYAFYARRPLGFVLLLTAGIAFMYFFIAGVTQRKEPKTTKILVSIILSAVLINATYITVQIFNPNTYTENSGPTMWNPELADFTDTLCENAHTDEEKVQAIYTWIKDNITYDNEKDPVFQHFNVSDTLRTKSGLCYDFACLFTAMCRSQNIPCTNVDGDPIVGGYSHTWNRVYFNGSWWNVDVTNDAQAERKAKSLYGFHKLDSLSSPDSDYFIKRIY